MAYTRPKIAVIGAGNTGATTALTLAQEDLGDSVILDISAQDHPTKGKALDLREAGPVQPLHARVKGTSNYEEIQGAHMVIITAGIARKPGMSRDDLVATNAKIMRSISAKVAQYAPNSYILVLSNPVDAMTYVC